MAEQTTAAPTATLELPRVQVGNDPNGWNNSNAQAQRDLADRLGLTRDIESMFATGMTASQVTTTLRRGDRFGGIPIEEQSGLVMQARATLGIPSAATAEGAKEFQEWKRQRDERVAVHLRVDDAGRATSVVWPKTAMVAAARFTPSGSRPVGRP